jgi:hypothetical protein
MLKEMSSGRQAQPWRRWFTDEEFDLIVWFSRQGTPDGFQLCYDRKGHERALTWTEDAGYSHDRIDDGEGNPTKNRSPILVSDGVFPAAEVLRRFEATSSGIESHIRQFVAQKLREYASNTAKA